MAEAARVSWCFLALVLVTSKGIHAKPFFFGNMWCDLMCEEYEDGVDDSLGSVSTTTQDSWDPCSDCPVRPSRGFTVTTPNPRNFLPWSLMLPPGNMVGMNLTNVAGGPPGGGWIVQPWNGQAFPGPFPGPFPGFPITVATPAPAPAPAASSAAPSASSAAPLSAAPAATTAAATAATAATTAAPATTAAAG